MKQHFKYIIAKIIRLSKGIKATIHNISTYAKYKIYLILFTSLVAII